MRQRTSSRLLTTLLLVGAAAALSACAGSDPTPSTIANLENPQKVTLSQAQLEVIRRDVDPYIRNAVAEGAELDVAAAEYTQVQAVSAGGKVYVCGYAKAMNVQIEVRRKLAFAGELVGSSLFLREYIGGNEGQNDFVRAVCAKRGMELS
jgi:hypothetical protein